MKAAIGTSLTFFSFLFISTSATAQIHKSQLELGFSGGLTIYQGDLTPSPIGSYRTPGINVNLFTGYRLSSTVSVRANLALGKLHGDDAAYAKPEWRSHRSFAFSSPLTELSAMVVYHPAGRDRKISPYFFTGAGLASLRSKPTANSFDADYFAAEPGLPAAIREDFSHGTPRLLPVIPVGAGVQYKLSPTVFLMAETNYRLTASDYIDGFSTSANPSLKDHYLTHSIGVIYRFRKKNALDCPDPKSLNRY